MTEMSLPKMVRRVVVLDDDGTATVYKKKKKKKKNSRFLKPFEKATRRVLKSDKIFHVDILKRFDKSNGKKKDGWIRDMYKNGIKSGAKSEKVLLKMVRL